MIVVDASAVVAFLLNEAGADRVYARLFGAEETVLAPHLIDLEVAQVMRRHVYAHGLDPRRGETALTHLRDLPISRHPHEGLLPRIWELRDNLTAYDAAYVALAEALGAPLVTRDARLAAAPGHGAAIEVI